MKNNLYRIFLSALVLYFIFFIFYGLNWGSPYYFHPDERNIASSVSQLNLFTNINPHFFAYGALPIYFVYLLSIIINYLSNNFIFNPHVTFELAIILGRVVSALLTLALAFLIYKVTNDLSGKKAALIALIFSLTGTAFFQFSHFGTFEVWISFFSLLMAYCFILFQQTKKQICFITGSAVFGVLCAIKISSIVLLPVPLFVILVETFSGKTLHVRIRTFIKALLLFVFFSFLLYVISAPFNLINYESFFSSMKYEGGVATGILPVFYTGEFYNSVPIIFQYKNVLPFLVNPVITFLSIPAIIYSIYIVIKKKNIPLGIFVLSFVLIFVSGSFLFAKWTRYIVPAVPFLYILVAIFLEKMVTKTKLIKPVLIFFVIIGLFFSFSYIKTVRINKDTRSQALEFANNNIGNNSNILSEVYDMGIVTFNNNFHNITLFNFYDLENNPSLKLELPNILKKSDYIILPSQRVYKTRIVNSHRFPKGYKFYSDLFLGKLGFKKIYETPCDIFCKITYLGDPVFNVEQTVNVFDRPTVYIFKRQ